MISKIDSKRWVYVRTRTVLVLSVESDGTGHWSCGPIFQLTGYTSTRKPGRDEGQFKSGMRCPDCDYERDCHMVEEGGCRGPVAHGRG